MYESLFSLKAISPEVSKHTVSIELGDIWTLMSAMRYDMGLVRYLTFIYQVLLCNAMYVFETSIMAKGLDQKPHSKITLLPLVFELLTF